MRTPISDTLLSDGRVLLSEPGSEIDRFQQKGDHFVFIATN